MMLIQILRFSASIDARDSKIPLYGCTASRSLSDGRIIPAERSPVAGSSRAFCV